MQHAPLSISAAYRWTKCPGSFELGKKAPPSVTSPYAAEGTTIAKYIELALVELCEKQSMEGYEAVIKDIVDDEMKQHTRDYVLWLMTLEKAFVNGRPAKRLIEQKVRFSENIWGTPDYCCVCGDSAIIVDFKYGRGVPVDVKENLQLILYALALDNLVDGAVKKFSCFVYQPRLDNDKPYSRWDFDNKEEWQKFFATAEKAILVDKSETLMLGDHCRFCNAQVICPAQKEALTKELSVMTDNLPKAQLEHLIQIQGRKKQIEHFLSEVEKFLTERIKSGLEVPGYKLVESQKRRKWKGDVGAELMALGIPEPYEKSLIGITVAEKIAGKGKINHLCEWSGGALQLAAESDKRESVKGNETLLAMLPTGE